MIDYRRSFQPLENRFILAARPKYLNETDAQYILSKKIFHTYLVLKEYEDRVLCLQIGTFHEDKNKEAMRISKNLYPFFENNVYDLRIDGNLHFISKLDIEKVSDEVISKEDYKKVIKSFNDIHFTSLSLEEKKLARERLAEIYSNLIGKGYLIQLRRAVTNGILDNYYVNDVLDNNDLELIPFRYEPKVGLYFESLDKVYLNMKDIFLANYFYTEESYLRIRQMLDEKALTFKK